MFVQYWEEVDDDADEVLENDDRDVVEEDDDELQRLFQVADISGVLGGVKALVNPAGVILMALGCVTLCWRDKFPLLFVGL